MAWPCNVYRIECPESKVQSCPGLERRIQNRRIPGIASFSGGTGVRRPPRAQLLTPTPRPLVDSLSPALSPRASQGEGAGGFRDGGGSRCAQPRATLDFELSTFDLICGAMAIDPESPLDKLWQEYGRVFHDFDDLTLARWLSQTLGQLKGRAWRLSHPLLGAYRLAGQIAHDRQSWLKRLATPPAAYSEAPCCRAPLLPLLTRDVLESGLVCQHCSGTATPFEEIPPELQPTVRSWAEEYAPVHAVAHWEDRQRKRAADYDRAYENAAKEAERLLAQAGGQIAPKFLDFYPAVVWEDQDECLEVRPEDIPL